MNRNDEMNHAPKKKVLILLITTATFGILSRKYLSGENPALYYDFSMPLEFLGIKDFKNE